MPFRTYKAILRSLQENYANNDRYMNNNVDILSSAAGAQVRAGHDDDLEGFIGFKFWQSWTFGDPLKKLNPR